MWPSVEGFIQQMFCLHSSLTFERRHLCRLRLASEALEERRVQALADIIGERNGFGIAENLNGFAAGVDNQAAIGAAGEVKFEVVSHAGVEDSVEIAR